MIRAVVVMGVCGCGKSTLGAALAARLGWPFIEGDDCHPPANVAKMAAGRPLDDQDRLPFLQKVGDRLAAHPAGAVASCSALTRGYRDLIRARAGDPLFVLPLLPPERLAARLDRPGHFMPATLLASQLALLEPPGANERALLVDGAWPTGRQVNAVVAALAPLRSSRKDLHGPRLRAPT